MHNREDDYASSGLRGLADFVKTLMKNYEGNFVVRPMDEAYFIYRINTGMHRCF